jgi:hypothetical protein
MEEEEAGMESVSFKGSVNGFTLLAKRRAKRSHLPAKNFQRSATVTQ